MSTRAYTGRFPGLLDQVSAARKAVTSSLGERHPCREDAVLLTSEAVTNAIQHTASGSVGGDGTVGTFTLAVLHTARWVRVEVADQGAPTMPCACRSDSDATRGRGIPMINTLAARWGITREPDGTRVWFELRA